ncbi:hypothetical protein PENTCL1PPCAC_20871, partial [Pristionchus entomophagus]
EQGGEWSCEAEISYEICPLFTFSPRKLLKFHGKTSHVLETATHVAWSELSDPNFFYFYGGNVIVNFLIKIISSERIEAAPILDVSKFPSSVESHNVTLAIGDQKVKVSKDFLTNHSPVLTAMLYGNFAENGKEEVELKDIIYEEFIDL